MMLTQTVMTMVLLGACFGDVGHSVHRFHEPIGEPPRAASVGDTLAKIPAPAWPGLTALRCFVPPVRS